MIQIQNKFNVCQAMQDDRTTDGQKDYKIIRGEAYYEEGDYDENNGQK